MRSPLRLLGPTLAASLAACAQPPASPAPAARVDTVRIVRVDTLRVAGGESQEAQDRLAGLQIQLLERDVELRELQEQLESTRLELVRNMARLQTQASRAEAASGMSEAEIAMGTLRRAPGAAALPELARAQDLFALSSTEFADENYGGALYLATQVRALVRSGQARLRGRGEAAEVPGETLFALPVPLRASSRTNVRSGPGTSFAVAFTLDAGAAVVGQSHTNQWVRIVDEQNRQGWSQTRHRGSSRTRSQARARSGQGQFPGLPPRRAASGQALFTGRPPLTPSAVEGRPTLS